MDQDRLFSLDVMRGLTVVGMIVVNTTAYLQSLGGYGAYPALLHSEWAGFTVADAVFPAFVFMVGASIPLALRRDSGKAAATPALAARIGWRTLRLVSIGLLISNLYFLADPAANAFRPMGVLQRIGLCYGAAALTYLVSGWRTRLGACVLTLLAYWALCLVPTPDGVPVDLHRPGTDLIAWVDRAVLGDHAFAKGPTGFDPEGPLSTLPAIAQCLMGVLAGEWLLRAPRSQPTAARLGAAGLVLTAAGLAWSLAYPPVKAIWTSSYVLVSSGLSLMVLATCFWLWDVRRIPAWAGGFFTAFGLNAIFAYVLHELASIAIAGQWMRVPYGSALPWLGPQASALVCVAIFVAMIWAPVEYLRRRNWIIKV